MSRGRGDQLPLEYDSGWKRAHAWELLLAEISRTVAAVGLKEVAFRLDVSPSHLSHALQGRERHHVRAEWLPYLLEVAPDNKGLEVLASTRGMTTVQAKTLTPEEELAELKKALAEALGPELRNTIYARVYR